MIKCYLEPPVHHCCWNTGNSSSSEKRLLLQEENKILYTHYQSLQHISWLYNWNARFSACKTALHILQTAATETKKCITICVVFNYLSCYWKVNNWRHLLRKNYLSCCYLWILLLDIKRMWLHHAHEKQIRFAKWYIVALSVIKLSNHYIGETLFSKMLKGMMK